MARPPIARNVCSLPPVAEFVPSVSCGIVGEVIMTVDEYEAVKLIDYDGLSQQECAQQMGVARTTVQAIYGNARRKLSLCLVEGSALRIQGGDYEICPGGRTSCVHFGTCTRMSGRS